MLLQIQPKEQNPANASWFFIIIRFVHEHDLKLVTCWKWCITSLLIKQGKFYMIAVIGVDLTFYQIILLPEAKWVHLNLLFKLNNSSVIKAD